MYLFRHLRFLVIVVIYMLLAGCSTHQPVKPASPPNVNVELKKTPFFPQQQYQCGPAALAMMLQAAGIDIQPDDLTPYLYLPEKQGSLQLELIASIRNNQRIPYVLEPVIEAIVGELLAGRPVLVLQNLGLKILPAYHYAVVVGMQPRGQVVLRSGTTKRLVLDFNDFLTSWKKAGSWAVVVLNHDELPTDLDLTKYLKTLSEIETTGNILLAEGGYRTILKYYPEQPTALFGLANSLFVQENFTEAASIYRKLLNDRPTHAAAANNLAETLARLQCFKQALELLDTFLQETSRNNNLTTILEATRNDIDERSKKKRSNEFDCQVK